MVPFLVDSFEKYNNSNLHHTKLLYPFDVGNNVHRNIEDVLFVNGLLG